MDTERVTWQSGWGPSESGGRGREREAYCLSLIPLQEGLGLRTDSLLLESLSLIIASKSCCKVHTKKIFAFCLSHPLPSIPPFVCYLYSVLACHPPSDSVPSRRCPSLIVSACIPVSPSHFLSPPPPSFLLRLVFSPVQRPVDILSFTSHSGSGWECCDHVYCQSTAAARLQWGSCAVLSIFLTTFFIEFTGLVLNQRSSGYFSACCKASLRQ